MSLLELGWTADLQAAWNEIEGCHEPASGHQPARVAAEWRGAYDVWTETGAVRATVAGSLLHEGAEPPAVGDWVALDEGARIRRLLPRRSLLRRKAAGRAALQQAVAANLDTVFVVTAVDGDVNPRRIERYTTAVWDAGATPVVLINKVDLAEDARVLRAEVERVAPGVLVLAISAVTGLGLEQLGRYLQPGATVALVGSSGVGKSTLVNRLAGLGLETEQLGVDGKGQHTTTNRQMFRLPSGGLVIDTPGMRELGLTDASEGLAAAFVDVEDLAAGCGYRDCQHETEPGCAVRDAIDVGVLSAGRLESYRKLQRELERFALRQDGLARSQSKKKRRAFSRMCRKRMKARYGE